ncbi:MAG TPA: hypothetical protein PLA12_12550 [Candidatus Hydrogenedens sp.]|nr:hypothetical protein [Candidatus Hydrogenedens sp.]
MVSHSVAIRVVLYGILKPPVTLKAGVDLVVLQTSRLQEAIYISNLLVETPSFFPPMTCD